jgi:glycosyltransferase involved in cell wall biosynthesis
MSASENCWSGLSDGFRSARSGGCFSLKEFDIAVIIPCYNEAPTIGQVVQDFHRYLPGAKVYVFDNDSNDNTAAVARAAGATVIREGRRGKGNVVRRMFAEVLADAYVMVDGDGTYDAAAAPEMIELLLVQRLDMVVGTRLESREQGLFRRGHRFGNRLLTAIVRLMFGRAFEDVLSGYRIFSQRFVKSFPANSTGFEIETEMSIHALQLKLPTSEYRIEYFPRHLDSTSKLKSYRDGFRILRLIVYLVRDVRPMLFFTSMAACFLIAAVALGFPLLVTFVQTGLVPRLPTAVLATGLILLSSLSFTCGLILDSVVNGRVEQKRLAYLAQNSRR